MKSFPLFLLCKEENGCPIYYNSENNKLYAGQNGKLNENPNFPVLLVQPVLVFAAKALNSWLLDWDMMVRRLLCGALLVLSAFFLHLFVKTLLEGKGTPESRGLRELLTPSPAEWERYLGLAGEQLKKQLGICLGIGAGVMLCAGIFLWNADTIVFLVYIFLCLLFGIMAGGCHPVRKYQLIKNSRI